MQIEKIFFFPQLDLNRSFQEFPVLLLDSMSGSVITDCFMSDFPLPS